MVACVLDIWVDIGGGMKVEGEGWVHIYKSHGKMWVNGRQRDTAIVDGVSFEVGAIPAKAEIWLRGKRQKKVWDDSLTSTLDEQGKTYDEGSGSPVSLF